MIYPVPLGIDPTTHRCGCGSDFRMPLIDGREVLICRADEAHDTYQSKHKETRQLRRIDGSLAEVNILTGKETTELAPITDQATALAAVKRSIAIGQFSGKQTEVQIIQIAQLALAYRLDPMQEEIIPMYGRPYITIKGRRRLDAAAGNRFGLVWKVPNTEFLEYYQSVGAIDKGDVVAVAVGTYIDHPDAPVEVWARCKQTEVAGNDPHLPINAWKLEMAQKRCERKLREQMFGPIPRPKGLEHIDVLQEGDETNIVEGSARVVEDTPKKTRAKSPSKQQAKTTCEKHNNPSGAPYPFVNGQHPIMDADRNLEGWCKEDGASPAVDTGTGEILDLGEGPEPNAEDADAGNALYQTHLAEPEAGAGGGQPW